MAVRSIATLSVSFGLVSIPVRVYLATDNQAALRFKLMAPGGARMRQQYVADRRAVPPNLAPADADASADGDPDRETDVDADTDAGPEPHAGAEPTPTGPARAAPERVRLLRSGPPSQEPAPPPAQDRPARGNPLDVPHPGAPEEFVVARQDMVKGYEVDKGRYVLFTAAELDALAARSRQTIDIVSFVPVGSVDPLYFDKAYYLAPAERAQRPYSLLHRALTRTAHCALAKWAWRSKEYVVQLRAVEGGIVLQQLLYAPEVRPIAQLGVELVDVGEAELKLAIQLIEQAAAPRYDPAAFVDEERQRILDAVARKLQGSATVTPQPPPTARAADNVVDLLAALRASLAPRPNPASAPARARKPARRTAAPAAAKRAKAGKA